MPRVSILISCRNAARTLPDTIASIEAQTFRDYEVWAVDDGSTDDTARVLEAWARCDDRVGVLHHRGEGVVRASEAMRDRAAGELVARIDADDLARPERLERQVALLDERPGLAAVGSRVRYFPPDAVGPGMRRYERWINSVTTPDQVRREIFVECPLAHPALLIRSTVLDAVGGYRDMGWPEDYDLVLRVWEAGHAMANVPEVLLDWRIRETSFSRTDPRYSLDAFRRCKAHFLKRTLLRERDGAVVWGAGKVGKPFALELQAQGVEVRAFVELDPRKIGQEIHGAPVIPSDAVDDYRGALVCAAVGSPGARRDIRRELDARGWVEMEDYVAVA